MTVTSRVCPVVRSMFFNRTYFDLLFLPRDNFEDLELWGLLDPGNCSWVAACWALTRAELSRGFRVDVPTMTRERTVSISRHFMLHLWVTNCCSTWWCFYCISTWSIKISIFLRTNTDVSTSIMWIAKIFSLGFPQPRIQRNVAFCGSHRGSFHEVQLDHAKMSSWKRNSNIPFLTSHMRHLKASALFRNVHTEQSQ